MTFLILLFFLPVSSGLGIPPSRPKSESENVDTVLHRPVVQAAPALSLVDYEHEPDAQDEEEEEEEEEVPDANEKAGPGINEAVLLLENKENSQDGMVRKSSILSNGRYFESVTHYNVIEVHCCFCLIKGELILSKLVLYAADKGI